MTRERLLGGSLLSLQLPLTALLGNATTPCSYKQAAGFEAASSSRGDTCLVARMHDVRYFGSAAVPQTPHICANIATPQYFAGRNDNKV